MEVWEDWQHVSWTHWLHLTIQHGDMVSDMNTESSDKSLRMETKCKSLIIGWSTETLGKSKESISNIRSTLEVKSEKPLIIKEMRDHIGKKLKLSSQEHTIPQFLAMPLSILLDSDFGNLSQSTSSTSWPSTVVTTTRRFNNVRRPSISPVSFIPMTQHSKVRNFVLNNNIFSSQPQFKISFVDIKSIARRTNVSLSGKTSPMRLPSSSTTLIQPLVLLNCSESWSMRNIWIKKLLGTSFMTLSHTLITLFCLKPLKNGVLNSWTDFCQDIWNSFTWLTTSGWPELARSTQEMPIRWMFFLWSKKVFQREFVWPTFALSVLTRSTVLPIFTRNFWNLTFSKISTKFSQTNSSTRQTELPQEDGFSAQILDWPNFTVSISKLMNGFWTWPSWENLKSTLMTLNSETNGELSRRKTKLSWLNGSRENAKSKSTLKACSTSKLREFTNTNVNWWTSFTLFTVTSA